MPVRFNISLSPSVRALPSRLAGAALCLLLALLLCAPRALAAESGAAAAAAESAEKALAASISRVVELLQNPGYVSPQTRGPLRTQIEDEVYHIFDFGEFSARTVGQRWQTFTDAQQQDFTDAFASLLFSTYLSQIDGYNGEEVRYTGVRSNPEGTRVEVATELTNQNGRVIPIAYRLMPKNGTWVVYDVFVEGVSLVRNYRTQFQDILSKSNPDSLIVRVRERAMEVAADGTAN
ncbi:MAG: ABC transporter substrate-binding protein [Desulfovibrionaceae bacterium]|nr:ABC transporter substrate-binding protein [Desulfovibrionaceae bacterium]